MSLLALVGLLVACDTSIRDHSGESRVVTAESLAQSRNTKGIVLLDVNWGRRWGCGGFENAALRGLPFDRRPLMKSSADLGADLTLTQTPNLASRPVFFNCALPPVR